MQKPKKSTHINWTNTLFLLLVPLVAIIGTAYIIMNGEVHTATVILGIVIWVLVGLSITCGYHRLFSHQSYKAAWPVRLVLTLLGTAAFEGSVLEWSTDHRNHHRYTDTDKDPYDIKKGFWFAHMGWLFTLDTSKRDFSNVEDLQKDPILRFQHRFFVPLAAFLTFALPAIIAASWGDAFGGFMIAGCLRLVFTQQSTFCINSVCHLFGKHTYKEQSARDNWFTALFTFGEGYHNFHHQFALDYRNGIRTWDFDPAKWIIRALSYLGLTSDLKRVSDEKLIRYQVQAEEHRVLKYIQTHSDSLMHHISLKMIPLKERLLEVAVQVEILEKNYRELKLQKMDYLKGKMSDYRALVKKEHAHLKRAQRDLKHAMINWRHFVRHRVKHLAV